MLIGVSTADDWRRSPPVKCHRQWGCVDVGVWARGSGLDFGMEAYGLHAINAGGELSG